MGFFRRDRPLHEQLAQEGGLDFGAEQTPSPAEGLMEGRDDGFRSTPPAEFGDLSPFGEVGIHGVQRPRRWDVVATARVEMPGEKVHFVVLPDGTLVVDENVPDGSLTPLADAIEVTLNPPYRAEAVRQEDGVWAVAASRITVREFPEAEDDELELVEDGNVVIGRRLDGDLFEVEVTPL